MLEIVTVNLSKLKPDKRNARKHNDRNIAEIMRSIESFGQHRPFVVQRDTEKILIGNGMYTAMKKMGIKQALVLYVDDDNEMAARRSIADNRTGELAEWDMDILREFVEKLGTSANIPGWNENELESLCNLSPLPDVEPPHSEHAPKDEKLIKCPECGHEFTL